MINSPRVAVIIVNWNGWQDTLECLESLLASDYKNFQLIVCDNASSDGSVQHLREWARAKGLGDQLLVLETGANLGFAGGNNVGLRYALQNDFAYMWLLNNDTVVDPAALSQLVKRMQPQPQAGMCGSTVVYYHNRGIIEAMGGARYDRWVGVGKHLGIGQPVNCQKDVARVEKQMDYVFGASLLVSRQFLLDIGLMSEEYFIYCEEIDWALRARPQYSLAYASESIVYHKGSSSTGLKEKSDTAKYYEIRNRILVTRRHFPYALPTVYLGIVVEMSGFFLSGQWRQGKLLFSVLAKT